MTNQIHHSLRVISNDDDPFTIAERSRVALAAPTAQTMTSLEVSNLVGSEHPKVRLSMERLAERGVISLSPLSKVRIQRERREEVVEVYNLTERDSYIVVAQLSPEFTARLVDRWRKLESDLLNTPRINSEAKLMMSLPMYAEIKAQAYKDVQADLKGVGCAKFNRAIKTVWGGIGSTIPEAARDQLQSMLEFYMLNAFGFVKQRPVEQREIQRFGEWSK